MAISEYPSLQLANRQTDLNGAVEQIWQGKGSELMRPIFDTYNDDLHRAVDAVPSLDEEKAKLFKNNVTRTASAKANYTIQLLDKAKQAANGNKDEYLRQSKVIMGRANRSQAAEYNTAVHRARSAQQWAVFQKQKHLYPNLQWLRTRSATPREIHLAYVGRIWAMDDPFWNDNQPGCTWNCKCSWKTTDAPVTDNGNVTIVPSAQGLEGNPYYTNQIFTDKHPYISRVANHVPDLGVLNNPDDVVYLNGVEKGVKYKVHFNAQKEFDTVNKPYLPYIEKAGYDNVKFLPIVERHETELRKRYFGKYWESNKCADVLHEKTLIELKTVANAGRKTRRNIVSQIGDAAKKADVVILKSEKLLDFGQIAKTEFEKYSNLTRIIFFFDDNMFDFVP